MAKVLTVSLPDDVWAWVKRSAPKQRVTVSHLVLKALLPIFEARESKRRGKA